METIDPRAVLERLIQERSVTYGAVSKLLGRNPAYIQQFVKRGTPRKLDEADRRVLARFFSVDERLLGAPEEPTWRKGAERGTGRREGLVAVPRLALGASAGAGSLQEDEPAIGTFSFDRRWVRALGGRPDMLSIIRVDGESMQPTLGDGDDIMVDRSDGAERLRDGIYVLRMDGVLMVKRVALASGLGRFSVRSDNPLYPTWENIDPDLVSIIGRVIWSGRRIG
ncbi:MAG: peptidase S24 [Sphingobium sp. 66-54]|nr:MAG: peptidase S24 [Sphingobium sp. 66-54]